MAGENRIGRAEKCWARRSRGPRRVRRRRRARCPVAPPGGSQDRRRRCRPDGREALAPDAAPHLLDPISMCRKRSFATHRPGRRQTRAGVCLKPCLILCLADVERKRVARRPVTDTLATVGPVSLPQRRQNMVSRHHRTRCTVVVCPMDCTRLLDRNRR